MPYLSYLEPGWLAVSCAAGLDCELELRAHVPIRPIAGHRSEQWFGGVH